jgi:prolyl oligopeptidase
MRKIVPLLISISFISETFAQYLYPPTRIVDSSDTYFGVTYKDPYRWLEKIAQPETAAWFKEQANYTDSILNRLKGRDELIAEWEKADQQFPVFNSNRQFENGRMFYRKTTSAASVGKIYYKEDGTNKEELLFDPTEYIPGETLSVQNFEPSFDGKKLAIEYTRQGAEISIIKIIDVDTKLFLKDSLYTEEFSGWAFDNNSFLYQWLKSIDTKDPTWRYNSKTKVHVLGTDTSADVDFFSSASYPGLNIGPSVYPFAYLAENARNYIFAEVEYTKYYAPIREFNSKKISWNVLSTSADSLVQEIAINDNIYAISNKNASNYKVLETSLTHPNWDNAVTIAAEKPDQIIKTFAHSKDYLLIVYTEGMVNHLVKYNFATKTTSDVKLPFSGSIWVDCINSKTNKCIVRVTSWNEPVTEYDYDAGTDAFMVSTFNKPFVYPAAYNNLEVDEVEVKGYDGTMIPLSIIHKKGTRKDSSNICLLEGYGAYGTSINPYFNGLKNSLPSRGVVIAIAHVRGGGEKGEAWHRAGFKSTKPNTWKDFISCAEYLIAKGYTAPQKLAGMGASAGGILISRAITERPDLFAAAICNVGAANALRLQFSGNTGNVYEFGSLKDSSECRALYQMDGVAHVVAGTKYPGVICVGGWNDPRVPVWQPGKFAAALQKASSSGKPVLMKINYDNGHSTEDRTVTYINSANQFAFILWQCGHPDFQPKE